MFSAKIISPEKTLFEGEIKAFAAVNDTGPFSMLASHANFITLIKDNITVHLPDGTKQEIPIGHGVLANKNNQIRAFVGFRALAKDSTLNLTEK